MWKPTKNFLDATQRKKNGRIGPKKAQNSNHSKKSKSQKTKILQNESYQWTLKKFSDQHLIKNRPIGTKKAQSDLPKAKNQIARIQ